MKNLAAFTGMLFAAAVACGEVAVIVHPSNPTASMSADQVANLFLGKTSELTPVDLPENSPVRTELYKKVTDKDAAQVKAIWTRLIFTGKATPPKEVASGAAAKQAVADNPKAISYIDKSEVDGSVKVVYTTQ
jgi:hypothetical protein